MIPIAWALPVAGARSSLSPLTEGRVPLTKRSSRFTEPLEQPVELKYTDPADADRVVCYGRCFTLNEILDAQIDLGLRGVAMSTVTVGPPAAAKSVSQTGLPKPGAKT
jgi:hypothetical protein